MTIEYQLTKSDHLEYQLYSSSKSDLHRKGRFRSRIIVPIIYILSGLFVAGKTGSVNYAIVFIMIGIIWLAFYPFYSKWRYKRYFQSSIEEKFKNRENTPIELEINEDSVKVKEVDSETTIIGSKLKQLIETKNHFFIKVNTNEALVVPKNAIENEGEFKQHLTAWGAEYVNELLWYWQ